MQPIPLAEITDRALFGDKAAFLGAAARAGLSVPPGLALSVEDVDRYCGVASSDLKSSLAIAAASLGGPLAVRSSAIGEDSADASLAGALYTALNVEGPGAIEDSVRRVRDSGRSEAVIAYQRRLGCGHELRVAIVIQQLIDPVCAGVLFTRDPLDGSHITVVEACWGLGVGVALGLVIPDAFRVDADGRVRSEKLGTKDVAIRPKAAGDVERVPVDAASVGAPCVSREQLKALSILGRTCESVIGGPADVEWAIDRDARIHLLQLRPITALPRSRAF